MAMMVRSLAPWFYRGISKAVVLQIHKSIIRKEITGKKRKYVKCHRNILEYRNVQENTGYIQKGTEKYGSTKTIQGSRGDMYKVQGYMGVQRRYKGVEGRYRRVRGHIGEQRRFKGVEGICREKGTGIYGSTKTIQGSRGDMWRGTGLTYMVVNGKTV